MRNEKKQTNTAARTEKKRQDQFVLAHAQDLLRFAQIAMYSPMWNTGEFTRRLDNLMPRIQDIESSGDRWQAEAYIAEARKAAEEYALERMRGEV